MISALTVRNMSAPLFALIDSHSLASLRQVRDLAPPTLILLETSLVGLASEVAEHLASAWVSSDAKGDILQLAPEGDTWTVNEVQEKIIETTERYPLERHIIIVDQASAMDQSLADKLLKTIEEPTSPTTFIFCIDGAKRLPLTIEGRSAAHIRLNPASSATRSQELIKLGASPELASRAVELAGNQVALAPMMIENEEFFKAVEAVFTLDFKKPFLHAEEVNSNLSVVAASLTDSNAAPSKAVVRTLAKEVVNRYRSAIASKARSATSALEMKKVLESLDACDQAEAQISSYTSIPLVLSALYSQVK